MLTRKGAELRENIADRLDLPAEAAGLLKLTVMGRGRALIEQHRGLAGYTHERIEVLGGRTRLIINGEALELAAMDLLSIIRASKGGANKDLAKFADQVNSLCDKWDR